VATDSVMTSNCAGLPSTVSSQLFAYPDGWPDTSSAGQYTPSQVLSIHNQMLDYYLHTSDGIPMVSAVEPKIPGGPDGDGLLYGAYAVRFEATPVAGYKTAFLLWPDSEQWPQAGEIDFPEGDLNSYMTAAMHWLGGTSGAQQNYYKTDFTYSSWHTAVIEWTPNLCKFILDGQVVGTATSLVPNTPMHWVLQVETSLDEGVPSPSASGHVYVAWIAAYKQAS
jgi:hypothetical protein